MKTKLLLTFILLTNIVLAQWTRINNSPSNASHIYFYNSSLGYALKGDKIYKTTNGGTNWINMPTGLSSFDNVGDIKFATPDTGFIWVQNGMTFSYPVSIYFTINGGTSWSQLLGPFNNCYLDFHIAGKNDWYFYLNTDMLGADTIYHTTNGGLSWANTANATRVQYNQAINNLTVFKDSTTTNNTHLFYKSTNGGATWTLVLTDNTAVSAFMDHQFLNTSVGYVLLYQYNNTDNIPSKVYKTMDGGQNWQSYNLPLTCEGPHSIHFINATTGYIVSNNTTQGVLFKTTDGGQTWNADLTGLTNEYFSGSAGVFQYFGTLYLLGNDIISNMIVTTSVNEWKKDKISFNLFPNPSNGQIVVTSNASEKDKNFVVTDLTGSEIYAFAMEQNLSQSIDLSFLKNGVYLLKHKESAQSKLFVKE